jgi:hypothetical protein
LREGNVSEPKPEAIVDQLAGRPETEFPSSTMATVFADGVSGYAPGPGIIKFYLYRIDPNMFGRKGFKANPFAQVVMPSHGFAQTAAFFMHAVKNMIAAGALSQAQFDEMVNSIAQLNQPAATTAQPDA